MPAGGDPLGKVRVQIPGLGTVEGLEFPNGVSQFCGIKYATIEKRWTFSKLYSTWPEGTVHDGTKLGCSAPNPPEYNIEDDVINPVKPVPYHGTPPEDEFNCLVVNVTKPKLDTGNEKLPVMVFIHGGSFLFGGANASVYDQVNFVKYSQDRQTPVVAVNFNYRVGLGGFLASNAIKTDLETDGYSGVGNFGLADQQVALRWINKYISAFGGNPDEVTIYGESAGGMSVAHQVAARDPAPFVRAIAMSGHLNTIPAWTLEKHEQHYRALLEYLKINPDAPDSLEQLRAKSQEEIAAATLPVEGVFVATGNPCDDGVWHLERPNFESIPSPPSWVKGYMVGDVLDEGMIFDMSFAEETFDSVLTRLSSHVGKDHAATILKLYDITAELTAEDLNQKLQVLAGDTTFRVHNWISAHNSNVAQTFGYHFDRPSTYPGPLLGVAYHAIELLYCFLNFDEHLTEEQQKLARDMSDHFIDFAYGKDPWPRISDGRKWMRYGPTDTFTVVTEDQDDQVRKYSRMKEIMALGIYPQLVTAVDDIAVKRWRMGTFEWSPEPTESERFSEMLS